MRYINLPCSVRGLTVMDNEGFYNIYINARLSFEHQKKALMHELEHIIRNDFYKPCECLENIENII